MLASILRTQAGDAESALATRGNLNNDLGVPLTLLQLAPQHRSAVIELGASRIGEIAYTVELTRPHVAIITMPAPPMSASSADRRRSSRRRARYSKGWPPTAPPC